MTVTRQHYTETTRQLWGTALWCSLDLEGQPLDVEFDIYEDSTRMTFSGLKPIIGSSAIGLTRSS